MPYGARSTLRTRPLRRSRRASSDHSRPHGASATQTPTWRSSRSPELKIAVLARCSTTIISTATSELTRVCQPTMVATLATRSTRHTTRPAWSRAGGGARSTRPG